MCTIVKVFRLHVRIANNSRLETFKSDGFPISDSVMSKQSWNVLSSSFPYEVAKRMRQRAIVDLRDTLSIHNFNSTKRGASRTMKFILGCLALATSAKIQWSCEFIDRRIDSAFVRARFEWSVVTDIDEAKWIAVGATFKLAELRGKDSLLRQENDGWKEYWMDGKSLESYWLLLATRGRLLILFSKRPRSKGGVIPNETIDF